MGHHISQVVKLLWAYLREKRLQDPENLNYFTPDLAMQGIFGTQKIRGFAMGKYLKGHLTKP